MECVIVPNFFELRFKSIRVCLKRVIKTDLRIVCPTMFFQYFLKIFCDQKEIMGGYGQTFQRENPRYRNKLKITFS